MKTFANAGLLICFGCGAVSPVTASRPVLGVVSGDISPASLPFESTSDGKVCTSLDNYKDFALDLLGERAAYRSKLISCSEQRDKASAKSTIQPESASLWPYLVTAILSAAAGLAGGISVGLELRK